MKKWYAVYTKPRLEQAANDNLQRQAFETYLPWIEAQHRRRGRWQDVIEPLFPRYLFVNIDVRVQSTATIRSTRGVSNMVRFGDEPVAVPDRLVETLQQSADPETGLHIPNQPLFKNGDRVIVADGPFQDIVGIFQAPTGKERALILLDLLGRQNKIAIDYNKLVRAQA